MVYLADKELSNTFLPRDVRKRAEVMSWLMFQMVTPIIYTSCDGHVDVCHLLLSTLWYLSSASQHASAAQAHWQDSSLGAVRHCFAIYLLYACSKGLHSACHSATWGK